MKAGYIIATAFVFMGVLFMALGSVLQNSDLIATGFVSALFIGGIIGMSTKYWETMGE